MKGQWGLIIGIVVVLVISIFAVINVDPVEVNYLFGQNEWPLVLVIIGSVLMGGLIVGSVGMYKIYRLQQQVKRLEAENNQLKPDTSERSRVKERHKNKKDVDVSESEQS
ncbi:LapA family protein [Alteribacter aurantiacus]|uniref:LapA family protein n=1 Tax=Alteribacter aurantiacus TaxID=254410 RepID=UPI00047DAA77|nr:lipopolysaccharide assembly protein LapA domain-containing protein [Alteribacter aurantiacus]